MRISESQLRQIVRQEIAAKGGKRRPTLRESAELRRGAHRILLAMGKQVRLMESQGYSAKQQNDYVFKVLRGIERGRLDEGIMDTIGDVINWASDSKYLQPVQSWIGEKIANILDLDQGSLMRKIVVNFIENLEISKVMQMFGGEGACRPIVSELGGAVQEAIVEKTIDELGLTPTSTVGRVIQESIQASFVEDGPFVQKFTDFVCNLDIKDIMPGGQRDLAAAVGAGG